MVRAWVAQKTRKCYILRFFMSDLLKGRLPIYLRLQCDTFAMWSLIAPLLLYSHYVVTFELLWLLLVYLNLVSVSDFCVTSLIIFCILVYPCVLKYSFFTSFALNLTF